MLAIELANGAASYGTGKDAGAGSSAQAPPHTPSTEPL